VSATSAITVREIDRRLDELRAVVDRTTANLVELESDMTRQLLETSTSLRGATATAWSDASRRHAELWRGQFALENLLTKLTEQRGTRKSPAQATLVRLDEVLRQPSVELPRRSEEGRPGLTEGPMLTVAVTVDDVLAQMSADYDVVAGVVASVAEVWGERTEHLRALTSAVAALEERVREHGVREPDELPSIRRSIGEAETSARADPLGLDPDAVGRLGPAVAQLRLEVDDAVRRRAARSAERAAADQVIRAGIHALEACRVQLGRDAEKVVVPAESWAAVRRLATELDVVRRQVEGDPQDGSDDRGTGVLGRAQDVLDEVARLALAERGRMERRDELRGLLGAYLAKAQAIGLAENREVDDLYSVAQGVLYTAPCDLDVAERLCADFRRAVQPRAVGTP
jgi:hypothetical protein